MNDDENFESLVSVITGVTFDGQDVTFSYENDLSTNISLSWDFDDCLTTGTSSTISDYKDAELQSCKDEIKELRKRLRNLTIDFIEARSNKQVEEFMKSLDEVEEKVNAL